jgi:bacteriorhodopsin
MHFLAIVISRPGYYESLPLSWFVAVPLAFFPVILAFMSFSSKNGKDENNTNITFLYLISKILMVPGLIVYLITNASHHTVQYIVGLVLFLLIDVILIIILTIIIKNKQKSFHKSDGIPNELPDNSPDKTETP